MTRLFGVIGDPVAHSLSPLIHKGWMRDHGIDGDYLGLQVPDGRLAESLATCERRGFSGLNVTLPHKVAVMDLCEQVSPLARRIGAVNTLIRRPSGGWQGDNTDHDGFLRDFADALGRSPDGAHILILGAGGASKAVVHALVSAGAHVTIANRTLAKAEALAKAAGLAADCAISLRSAMDAMQSMDSLVNALSIGHVGESLDVPPGDGRLIYDLSYGRAARSVLDVAAARGWRARDGLGMLVGQAALAFQAWHAIMPDRERALQRCRAALEATQ